MLVSKSLRATSREDSISCRVVAKRHVDKTRQKIQESTDLHQMAVFMTIKSSSCFLLNYGVP
jgi:hypothetical protein